MLKTRSGGIAATVKRQVECHDGFALDKLRGVICGFWLPPSPDSETLHLRWPFCKFQDVKGVQRLTRWRVANSVIRNALDSQIKGDIVMH